MSKLFQKYAGLEAFLAGLSALAYAYFFVVAKDAMLSAVFLTLSGIFAVKVMVALYTRLQAVEKGFALLGVIFGVVGGLGMFVHGGYDLANAINPPASMDASLPSQVDPRGLLSFGASGLALFYVSFLMAKDKFFPKNLSMLGFLSGVLLLWIYIARLTILNPANPALLYAILAEGFVVNPIWYLWLGWVYKNSK